VIYRLAVVDREKMQKKRLPGHEKMLRCDNFLAEQFDLTVPEGSGKTKIN